MTIARNATLAAMRASYEALGGAIALLEAEIEADDQRPKIEALLTGWDILPKTMTLRQAANAAGVSYPTAINWTHDPTFPGKKRDGRWYIDRDALREWLMRRAA